MICNVCGNQEATLHLTEIIQDQMLEVHLCESCAQEKGTDFKTHFQLGDLLGSLSAPPANPMPGVAVPPAAQCAECGMTYEEFAKTGRLGCASCYQGLSKILLPLIKRVQRSTHHVGKQPARLSTPEKAAYDLRLLQERLRKSVELEAFEDAARIRDEIKEIEHKTQKGKKKK